MNPYKSQSSSAFWKTAISDFSMFEIGPLWVPKFEISAKHKVVTFGSCFAQHIGNALKARGYNWYISEPVPRGSSEDLKKRYNYDVFSARSGNIYTTSLLKQWVEWSLGIKDVPDEVWQSEGRFYDPFRPKIEPYGFESREELLCSRSKAIAAFRKCILESDVFVFTMGLTEAWFNREHEYEYPMCPGTAAGEYNESLHYFENQDFKTVYRNLKESIRLIKAENRSVRFILTVSPVPLVATNTSDNVLLATMYSKSVLRAVAGQLTKEIKYVDYFPSYEIINSPVFKGVFFEPNIRGVSSFGVNFVMDHFFRCQELSFGKKVNRPSKGRAEKVDTDVVCEEELLDAFGK